MLIQRSCTIALAAILISGCAEHYTIAANLDPYGFFSGIWHGLLAPYAIFANIISWLLSIFEITLWSDIKIIGRPNTGGTYYAGFVIGLLTDTRMYDYR